MSGDAVQAVKAHILVVEDESSILTLVSMMLELEGYRVSTATNGREGLHQLSMETPDLVMTDYMMPHMNGLEMIREIRGDPAYACLPIVLTSAALPTQIDTDALVDGILYKPFDMDQLLDAIGQALGSRG
jgi:CheY-like chemotaxis protein